jgi:hypothetical protein
MTAWGCPDVFPRIGAGQQRAGRENRRRAENRNRATVAGTRWIHMPRLLTMRTETRTENRDRKPGLDFSSPFHYHGTRSAASGESDFRVDSMEEGEMDVTV